MFSYDLFIVIVKFPEAATGGTPKNTFFIEYLQMTAFEFPQKDIDKFKECQTNEGIKKIHVRRKKQSMEQREINSSASYSH